tara:strand:- start:447 stop:857 length:411 start_codon:yes stop_codon:yes gene_type:complete
MSAYSGLSPIDCKDIQNTFTQSGLLVKYNAAGIMITTAKADVPIGVTIDESSRDAAGALEAAGTGTVSIIPLGGVQYIRCVGGGAMKTGESLYVDDANDGFVHTTATGAKFVGYYMGEDGITPASGDLIPVLCRSA